MSESQWSMWKKPEEAGVPSAAIMRLFRRIEQRGLCMHSLILLRHGKIAVEAYWAPYGPDDKQRMYSVSKSFAAAAIGILIGEGKLRLDDRVVTFFPEYATFPISPWTAVTTVHDLLVMSTPFSSSPYVDFDEWTRAFFEIEASHAPGTSFRYDTLASVMLGMIVRRLSGAETTEYLRDRLFGPAGMSTDIWCIQTRCGHDWMGSGVQATTRDLTRFAQVLMAGGRWNDRQLIPRDYVEAAVAPQIDNSVANSHPVFQHGYGYQIWCVPGGFALRGMGAQLAIALPAHDLILVTTADAQAVEDAQADITDLLFEELLPTLDTVSADDEPPADWIRFRDGLGDLKLLAVPGALSSPVAKKIDGRVYPLADNPLEWTWLSVRLAEGEGALLYGKAGREHQIRFGFGRQVRGEFPEKHYSGKRIGTPAGRGYTIHASAAWRLPDSLLIIVYATDWHLGTIKMNLVFKDEQVTLQAEKTAEFFFDEYQGYANSVIAE